MKECLRCKKMIPDNSLRDYCEICCEIYEKIFDKIRDYLREYPMATAFEVAEFTGIDHQIIKGFIKEGRLIEIEAESVNISCKRCGTLILSKHHEYCPKCEKALIKELNGVKGYFIKSDNAKMHHKKLTRDHP
jgi:Zn finger protein HypA/HybF involved in hydrogenase expression